MKSFMSNYSSHCYALMRIVAGFLFLWHGSQKLFGFPSGMPAGVPAFIIYGAGPIELIGGILVMIGLFTHWAAFITSGEMAVAYWMAHGPKARCRSRIKANSQCSTVSSFCSSPHRGAGSGASTPLGSDSSGAGH